MKELTNADDLVYELVSGRWAPNLLILASSDYPGLTYKCGCGEEHLLSYTKFIMVAAPVKFVFVCDNEYMTGVRVKGMFSETIELSTCKNELYLEAVEKVNSE